MSSEPKQPSDPDPQAEIEEGYKVFVTVVSSLIMIASVCGILSLFAIYAISGAVFPGDWRAADLLGTYCFVLVTIYFSIACWSGKFVWFLDSRFSVGRILLVVAAIAVILASMNGLIQEALKAVDAE